MENNCDCGSVFLDSENNVELCNCVFDIYKVLKNATVEILQCPKCGKVSIGWYQQSNTEDITDIFYSDSYELN